MTICNMSFSHVVQECNEEDPEKIELSQGDITKGESPQRTISYVDAFLIRTAFFVKLELCNIGYASIVLTNSSGDVVSRVTSDTTLPVTLSIPLPDVEDDYIIEIVSSKFRAYGYFSL